MKPSEDLFDLIKGLSIPERRKFKLDASRYSPEDREKKYLQLFDAMLKQAEYDEGAIRRQLKDVIPEKSFASTKRNLLQYVERFFRESKSGTDTAERVHELLREGELLLRRGHWSRGRAKIRDCKKLARQMEDTLALLKINETERRLAIEFERRSMDVQVNVLAEEWKGLVEVLQIEYAYSELFEHACLLIRMEFDHRSPEVAKMVPLLLGNDLLRKDVQPPTFKAKRYFHQTRAFLFHLSNQVGEEYAAYMSLIALWEAKPSFKASFRLLYKKALTNFLHCAAKLQRFEEFPVVMAAIAQFPAENQDDAAEDFQTVEFNRLLYYLNTGQLEEALKMVVTVEQGLKRYAAKVNNSRWLSFRINLAMTYFLNDKPQAAWKQTELILTSPLSDHRPDIQAYARILEPIFLYEMGNAPQSALKLHALREWLRSHERLYEFEKLLLSQMERLLKAPLEKISAVFISMHAAVERFQQSHPPALGADEVKLWAKARGSGQSFKVLLGRKV